MPHQTLKLVGGVIVNETPVINQTGIAQSNRIRFLPDQQGLSLPQKLGGWARFYATQIVGIIRALWGWQDTNENKWLAYVTDSTTAAEVVAIECTTNGSTGITTATGTPQNITPNNVSSLNALFIQSTTGSNQFSVTDPNVSPALSTALYSTVYVTTPINVGGVTLNGTYQIVSANSTAYVLAATDVLGNPLAATFSSTNNGLLSSATFNAGTPNTITFNFTSPVSYTIPPGQFVNLADNNNVATGSYIVLSSTATSFTVPTTLPGYTFVSGLFGTMGTVPLYATASGSSVITGTFANHGLAVGDTWYITNPTLVGGLNLYGAYTVQTVPNAYTFTITGPVASATSLQYQNAVPITGGTSTGTKLTLDFSTSVYTDVVAFNTPALGAMTILVQGANPSSWNGLWNMNGPPGVAGSVNMASTAAAASWVSGGSFSVVGASDVVGFQEAAGGGLAAFVFNIVNATGSGGTVPGSFPTLDNWGNDLIVVLDNSPVINYPTFPLVYQPIYYWDATGGIQLQAIANSPPANTGAFVAMPERQIIAWGSSFTGIIDPLQVRWSDINNFNTWAPQVTNQAGDFRFPSGSAIIGARQVFQFGLFWTDIELWQMTYLNLPLVYGFNKVGQGCGLIGKYAHNALNGVTFWMGKSQFFIFSGEGVQPLPCPVWDVAFQDLDLANVDKIVCATNAMFGEVAWYFPVVGSNGENSNYVKFNMLANLWDYGTISRSAWMDVSVLGQPIGADPNAGYIYQHEISPDADGLAMGESFTTGWFALADGDVMPYVDQIWPDFKWGYFAQAQSANVEMAFAAQPYPGASFYSYGPYTVSESTKYISPRIRSRLVNFTVTGTGTGTWWRLGGIRYRVQPDGKF